MAILAIRKRKIIVDGKDVSDMALSVSIHYSATEMDAVTIKLCGRIRIETKEDGQSETIIVEKY